MPGQGGVIDSASLGTYLANLQSTDKKLRLKAAVSVRNLAQHDDNRKFLVQQPRAAYFIVQALFVNMDDIDVSEKLLDSLCYLALADRIQDELGSAGVIPFLVKRLQDKSTSHTMQLLIVRLFICLIYDHEINAQQLADSEGIKSVAELLQLPGIDAELIGKIAILFSQLPQYEPIRTNITQPIMEALFTHLKDEVLDVGTRKSIIDSLVNMTLYDTPHLSFFLMGKTSEIVRLLFSFLKVTELRVDAATLLANFSASVLGDEISKVICDQKGIRSLMQMLNPDYDLQFRSWCASTLHHVVLQYPPSRLVFAKLDFSQVVPLFRLPEETAFNEKIDTIIGCLKMDPASATSESREHARMSQGYVSVSRDGILSIIAAALPEKPEMGGAGKGDEVVALATAKIPCEDLSYDPADPTAMLGGGSYGTVFRGEWNDATVAIKRLNMQHISAVAVKQLTQEANTMRALQHPHIIRIFGVCLDAGHFSLVMNLVRGGSLYRMLHDRSNELPEARRLSIAYQIAIAMRYLHKNGVLHRDVKSANVLVEPDDHVMLTDFGLAKVKQESQASFGGGEGAVGTTAWMAPEVIQGKRPSWPSDVYSFGVLLWEITTRAIPWGGLAEADIIKQVAQLRRSLPVPPADTSPLFSGLIRRCSIYSPQGRPAMDQVVLDLRRMQTR